MKLRTVISISALYCAVPSTAATSTGHVYIHDPLQDTSDWHHVQPRRLSPEMARMVLAQRIGVEDFHWPRYGISEDLIDAVNDFGRQTWLLDKQKQAGTAFIAVEGTGLPEATLSTLSLSHYRNFDVTSMPTAAAVEGLFLDFARQLDPASYANISDDAMLRRLRSDDALSTIQGHTFHLAKNAADFDSYLGRLVNQEKLPVIAFFAPASHHVSATASWGTYSMPGAQSLLVTREVPQKETPLEMDQPDESAKLQSNASSTAPLAFSSPLRGILPSCFPSMSTCQSLTRNCTGHGACVRVYTDSSSSGNAKSCYSCRCTATTSTDDDGHGVTTIWAGPACQKKDVSWQFWLIALFVVGMVFTVSFAVGEVWSMGEQELPSVIGAGVSGPVKK